MPVDHPIVQPPLEELRKPLGPLTSWHIGGVAERFCRPEGIDALAMYVQTLPKDTAITWLGLGSNVLIRDGGIKGAVISTLDLNGIIDKGDAGVWVEAGVPCAKFARFCCRLGLSDAAFFAGIPGTIGGALTMNAGAFGGETWPWVKQVQVVNREGKLLMRAPNDYHIAYREVKGVDAAQSKEAFVGALFQFPKTDKDGLADIKALLRKRGESQPIGTFNCGSVYRNPPGDHAARLIEACGLKGHGVGGAQISEKHANFIINIGDALAADVEQLMSVIEETVQTQFGIALHAEVRILGEKG